MHHVAQAGPELMATFLLQPERWVNILVQRPQNPDSSAEWILQSLRNRPLVGSLHKVSPVHPVVNQNPLSPFTTVAVTDYESGLAHFSFSLFSFPFPSFPFLFPSLPSIPLLLRWFFPPGTNQAFQISLTKNLLSQRI